MLEDGASLLRNSPDRWRLATVLGGLADVVDALGEDSSDHRTESSRILWSLGVSGDADAARYRQIWAGDSA